MLMKLMISLILPLPGAFLCLKHWCHWHRPPHPAELQTRRGLPVLGCFINFCCKNPIPPDLLSYRIFISVKARQPQKPLFNLLRLIWLVFLVWRSELSPEGEVEKGNAHLGTDLIFFFPLPDAIAYSWCFENKVNTGTSRCPRQHPPFTRSPCWTQTPKQANRE